MKKFYALAITALLFCMNASAQQMPIYSQLYFMRMLYNPALTAYNGQSDVYGFYRDQWTAMPGHPVTAGGLAELSLWKDQAGAGIHVYSDKTDIIHRTSAQLYYAQKIKLGQDHLLSIGFSGGIFEAHVDYNNAIAADPNDTHLLPSGKSGIAFDMNAGIAYQWKKKLTIGFSIPELANTKANILNQLESGQFQAKRTYIGSASYEFSFKEEKFNVEPSILVMNGSSKPVQIDASVMANYKRMLYLGLGYRSNYGMDIQAAVRISQVVTIGYAYELPIMGKKVKYADTKGTHEIIFGIHFDKLFKKKEETPKLDMIDSLMAKTEKLQKGVDSALRATDTLQKQVDSLKIQSTAAKAEQFEQEKKISLNDEKISEHDAVMKDMKQRMDSITNLVKDSLDNLVKEYKQRISAKPAVNFPDKVDASIKAKAGDTYRLNKVEFNSNSSYLKKESYSEMDKVVEFLKMNPNTNIRVSGHTDYTASDDYNQWLSDRRAKRVYDYLAEKGIPTDRMTYIGFGKKAPIADNSTEDGRALNRRVELEILK